MEPLSALGVAAAVAQFVDFGLKIAGNAREIYGSLSGATEENQHLETATYMTQRLTEKLVTSSLGGFAEEEAMLNDLVAECRALSTQLLELLNKLKAKDPKSKMQVALSSWRSRLYEKDKIHDFGFSDGPGFRSEIKEHLERFIVSSNNNFGNLNVLRGQVQEFSDGSTSRLTSINPEAREHLQNVYNLSSVLRVKAGEQVILDTLAFPGMRDRVDIVEKAHKATYSWIFDDLSGVKGGSPEPSDALLDETRRKQADAFVQWLSSGTGIYHIAGKLGSGKSTLMKYLASHRRVREELGKWAGDSVSSAFSHLVECAKTFGDSKFFFFIDGLDELEETPQDDFKAMVQLLSSWTHAAPNDIKLCVSSREYNVFVNFFSVEKKMRLQDLTLADMRRYVQERLQELPQEDLNRIVQVITEKANGIFLWVALVVKSIRAQLEDGCGTSMIEDEVNSLPDELEGLFQHLLASISKSYRKKAYQTFAMIKALPINDERPA
ncbi:hypothetical protein NEMBOFW57_006787 [Staphylotrichum longicolle]|uniref:Nephrocystin 3-like N-terminal domain-containing protein n=1 Tax=Staphylotrichum longicolle TaxID=669026 RepID=A0AAD4HYE0_9PEZI|nr:hypothetical protein NEMBOFW57_006787 [Staphylotrichum longicolle]